MDETQVPNYILFAIPVFFLLIGIELLYAKLTGKDYYRLNDSVNDLSLGSIQQLVMLTLRASVLTGYFALYGWIWQNYRFFSFELDSILGWVVGFLLVDLQYYWFHRKSHEVALIWGSHEPHHSSEEYNLAVALRQGALQPVLSWPFYLPIALLGIHPIVFFTCSQFNTIYQFWIHTRAIGRLGFLEWFMNTPSHHRVHHGVNPKYIDKNYAGVFIIWDRMFGTFQKEEEEPVYGTVEPLGTWNPIRANYRYWAKVFSLARRAPRFIDKIQIWFRSPEWLPEGLGPQRPIPEITRNEQVRYNPPLARGLGWYIFGQFVIVIAISVSALMLGPAIITPTGLFLSALGLLGFVVLGGLMERKAWAQRLEPIRLAATIALGAWVFAARGLVFEAALPLTVLGLAALVWFFRQPLAPATAAPATARAA